jgi:VCBS repeat-containing protein
VEEAEGSDAFGTGQLRLTKLADGGFVLNWREGAGTSEELSIHAGQAYNADGQELGGPLVFAPWGDSLDGLTPGSHTVVYALDNGGFAASTVLLADDDSLGRAYLQVFDADANPVGAVPIHAFGDGLLTFATIAPLQGPDFALLQSEIFPIGNGEVDGHVRLRTLSIGNPVSIEEDASGTFLLTTNLTDTDGSEIIDRIEISGVPDGWTVSHPTATASLAAGVWTIAGAAIAGGGEIELTLTPPADANGEATLVVTAFSRELSNSSVAASDPIIVGVNVTPVDDPAVAADDGFATDEATIVNGVVNVFDDNGSGADSDIDSSLAVTAVNGEADDVGDQITLPSGALLTLNADGTFSYDPNGAFETLPDPASGASNSSITDSFTYELNGGPTATVTITISGLDSDDVLIGTAGADTLNAGVGNDEVDALAGDDTIIGGSGAGDDDYDGGDDTDTLDYSSTTAGVTINLGAALNQATGAEIGTDQIRNVENVIGGSGGDFLRGDGLANSLQGGAGADRLDGRGGADSMEGGGGDDIFIVDDADDQVFELAGGGSNDKALASVSYRLAADQQVEVLATNSSTGTAAIDLTGNELAQTILGNAGANLIDGKGGADIMRGLNGNDIYRVDDAGDRVLEVAGGGTNDKVLASVSYTLAAGQQVESLTTNSSTGTAAINLTGNEFGQSILGNARGNILKGGGGADTLRGLGGADNLHAGIDDVRDRFIFTDVTESGTPGNAATWDQILEFDHDRGAGASTSDVIDLRLLDGDSSTPLRFVTDFSAGSGQVRAVDAGAHVNVQIDIDGNNSVDMVIQVLSIDTLTARDFLL